MKKVKKVLVVFLFAVLLTGGTGCMGILNRNMEDKIVNYLNSKYDDEFTFIESYGGTLFGGRSQKNIYCASKKYPGYLISGTYDIDNDVYYDNYIDVVYSGQIDELVGEMLKECFGQVRYYYEPFKNRTSNEGGDNYAADITFEDYLSSKYLMLTVFADNSGIVKKDEIVDTLKNRINEIGLNFSFIRLYLIDTYDEKIESDASVRNGIIVNEEYTHYLYAKAIGNSELHYIWEK